MVDPKNDFKPHGRQTLKQGVVDQVKKAIFDGRLKPGQRLNEAQLAAQMGLSKSPIREAVKEMASQGYLISEPFKGARVKELTRTEAEELFSLRAVLESFAVDRALRRMIPGDVERLSGLVERMEQAVSQADPAAAVEWTWSFTSCWLPLRAMASYWRCGPGYMSACGCTCI
jgi:DNA-binding GntR family transcriptional regulator